MPSPTWDDTVAIDVGTGIVIDPLESNSRKMITIVKANDGWTRIRISDASEDAGANSAAIEIDVQQSDAEKIGRFLLRCSK